MRNQLFMAVPAEAWERIFGEKGKQCPKCYGRGNYACGDYACGDWTFKHCEVCDGTGRVKE